MRHFGSNTIEKQFRDHVLALDENRLISMATFNRRSWFTDEGLAKPEACALVNQKIQGKTLFHLISEQFVNEFNSDVTSGLAAIYSQNPAFPQSISLTANQEKIITQFKILNELVLFTPNFDIEDSEGNTARSCLNTLGEPRLAEMIISGSLAREALEATHDMGARCSLGPS